MADITYTISGASGGNSTTWSGIIYDVSVDAAVTAGMASTITATDPDELIGSDPSDVDFVPSYIGRYQGDYVTFRSMDDTNQFPENQSGFSLDIWSDTFKSHVDSSYTWQQVIDNGAYTLNSDKWTLYYYYDETRGIRFGKGGTITFVSS